jgi:hypothetical protein
MIWAQGRFPMVIHVSADAGATSTEASAPASFSIGVLVYGNGRLVAIGEYTPSDPGLFYSDDAAATWQQGSASANFIEPGPRCSSPEPIAPLGWAPRRAEPESMPRTSAASAASGDAAPGVAA